MPLLAPQVFEYLSTDLKKWMDKTGKGPAHPLPKSVVKVRGLVLGATPSATVGPSLQK